MYPGARGSFFARAVFRAVRAILELGGWRRVFKLGIRMYDEDLRDHITHILVAGSSSPPGLALAIVFTSTTTQVLARMLVCLFWVCANTGVRAAVILILVAQSSHPLAHIHAQTHARAHKFRIL